MNKRIFPFEQKDNQWINRSEYLLWLNNNITSLQDYLNYFNPNYKLYNNSMNIINSKDWTEKNILPIDNNNINGQFISLHNLNWREGYYNDKEDVYLIINKDEYEKKQNNEINSLIQQGIIKPFAPQSSVFVSRWRHDVNDKLNTPDSFIQIAQPSAAFYMPFANNGGIAFTLLPNAQRTAGTNFIFGFTSSPIRYILNPKKNSWSTGIQYTIENFIPMDEKIVNIQSVEGIIWNGNPLMHECYLTQEKDNSHDYEEFVFDQEFSTSLTNVASQAITKYNIITKNITETETTKWQDTVHVLLL